MQKQFYLNTKTKKGFELNGQKLTFASIGIKTFVIKL
jgi:hypothetical protein